MESLILLLVDIFIKLRDFTSNIGLSNRLFLYIHNTIISRDFRRQPKHIIQIINVQRSKTTLFYDLSIQTGFNAIVEIRFFYVVFCHFTFQFRKVLFNFFFRQFLIFHRGQQFLPSFWHICRSHLRWLNIADSAI